MTKLSTADHVGAIIRILSADDWLADLRWERDRDTKVHVWQAPDGRIRTHEESSSGNDKLVATDEALWTDREAWNADRGNARLVAPFAKSGFKRLSKRKVGEEIRRSFSTPDMGVEADTFEKDGAIVRIEFRVLATPYIANKVAETRIVLGVDIPAAPPPEVVGYDVIDAMALETLITDVAIARLIEEDGEYETADDVRADYDPFKFETAVHNGFPYSRRVEDDLARVDFDGENTEIDFDAKGFEGFNTIGDLTFLGVMAGGDWESPVVFILYQSGGELRAYVPDGGNHYDRKNLRAWGNGDSEADEEMMEKCDDEAWDVKALRADIALHFGIAA